MFEIPIENRPCNYNCELYKRKDINDINVYDVSYNSKYKIKLKNELINPIYIIINDYIELVYSIQSKKLLIIDNSGKTDQEYLLSDNEENFIEKIDKMIDDIIDAVWCKYWTFQLKFNKAILNVLKFSEYENFMLYTNINDVNYVHISFKSFKYDEMELLFEGFRILYNILVDKINLENNQDIYKYRKLDGDYYD